MRKYRRLPSAAVVGLVLLGLMPLSADAQEVERDLFKRIDIEIPREAFGGLMSGTVIDWSVGVTQVRFNLVPDAKEGTNLDVATGEWELFLYAEGCGQRRTYPLLHEFFVNTTTYGPRVQAFLTSPKQGLTRQIGSIELIHDGPSAHHHVDELGVGRHLMGCVDV